MNKSDKPTFGLVFPASVQETKVALSNCKKRYPELYNDFYGLCLARENDRPPIVDRLKALLDDIDAAFALIPHEELYRKILINERQALQQAIILLEVFCK